MLFFNIDRMCKIKGWKFRTLAKTMGVASESLSRSLNGNPRLKTIERMANALGVPVKSLFDDPARVEGFITIKGDPKHFHSMEELISVINNSK